MLKIRKNSRLKNIIKIIINYRYFIFTFKEISSFEKASASTLQQIIFAMKNKEILTNAANIAGKGP